MSFRDKLRKLKSDAKSRIFQANEARNTNNAAGQSPTTPAPGRPHNWAYLRALLGSLEQATKPFSPLKAAVAELVGCIDIFEGMLDGRKEYEVLYNDLESLFQTLQGHCSQNIPPTITAAVESLCKSLRAEVAQIRRIQDKGKLREYLEANQDVEEILACYQRIQGYLQRISLNANMSVWRVVDEIATDNRLKHLSPSLSARYNSAQAIELKRGPCTAGTRVDLISRMLGWVDSANSGSVYWMSGMAGTGKTTLAYSLCLELEAGQRLVASFFCSRLLPECRDVNLIIPSIAYQLARLSHPFRFILSSALEKDPDVHTQLPHLQFETLIAQPLIEIKSTLPDSLVVVIDALDECENKEATSQILDVLLTRASDVPVKFVVSSRPEPEMRDEMTKQTDQGGSRVVLHELDKDTVQADIETYLRSALARIRPTDDQIAILTERAGILFIYAATVVRYIGHDRFRRNPLGRLASILELSSTSENKDKEIDDLYTAILRAALDDESLDSREREEMQQVLHTVICAYEPLTVQVLSSLLRVNSTDRIHAALRPFWSVLHISGAGDLVTTLHASFPDYMLNPTRSREYSCDPGARNQVIVQCCFDYFRDIRPQFNICWLESSYTPDEKVEGLEERIQAAVSPGLFYAARYWTRHLHSAVQSPDLVESLEEFLSVRLLLWMEVMTLKRCAGIMPQLIQLIEGWNINWSADLSALIHDAWRFTSAFALGAVSDSTPHIYTSMLPFWPEYSPIAKYYTRRTQGLIKTEGTAISQRQHSLLATWFFQDRVASPCFSPDGTLVAVGVWLKVYLLNSSTGRMILTLEGHQEFGWVSSIRFSPDGARLVAASDNGTIFVWNTQSGKTLLGPLRDTNCAYSNAAFSPDGASIALLARWDGSMCIRDAFSGECVVGPLELDNEVGILEPIRYSPDGRYIVFGSEAGITICDSRTGQKLRVVGSFDVSHRCTSFDISPDGTRIASGCGDDIIHVWDLETGALLSGPFNPSDADHAPIYSVSFSPSGLHLVSCSSGGIFVWDTQNGALVVGPIGEHAKCRSACFSPNGAYILSISYDRVVRLWDARSAHKISNSFRGHKKLFNTVGFSPDGTRIVSASEDRTVCVWNVESGEMVLGPINQSLYALPAVFPPKGCSHIISATRQKHMLLGTQTGNSTPISLPISYPVFSAEPSPDGTCILTSGLRVRDPRTGLLPRLSSIQALRLFSRDSRTNVIWVSAVDTGQVLLVIHLPPTKNRSILNPIATFSSDGNHIIVRSGSKTTSDHIQVLYVYDAHTGRLLHDKLQGYFPSFGLSPDGVQVASPSLYRFVVHNLNSGEVMVEPLEGHTQQVRSVAFSLDGTRIVSGAEDEAICVWDAQTGQRLIGPVKWHGGAVGAVGFSPGGTRVVSGSDDETIRVTDVKTAKVPDPSLESIGEWELREDGWVVDELSRLLVWIPPDLRTVLMWPRTKLLISRQGYLRLNFDGAHIGESWTKCYQPV